MKIKTEPALVTSAIVAVLGFIAPTLTIGDTQKALITGAVTAVLTILGGLHIRGKVTPTSVLEAAKTEAVTGAQEAVVYAQLHPDQVEQIITAVQTREGRAKLEQEAIAALTSGPHPMTLMPGADSTEPAPQPQGTYDAAEHPLHAVYEPVAAPSGSSPASGKHLATNA